MPTEPASPLPVSRLGLTAVLAGCALFLVLVLFLHHKPAPVQPDLTNVPAADRWKMTDEGRMEYLSKIRAEQDRMAETYGWVDQSKGVVRLPIERAMELTLRDINAQRNDSR